MLCKFWVVTRHLFFFMWNEISIGSERSCCLPRQRPSLHSIFLSVIRLWAKIWYRNKTACSKLNPVQSSRSLSMTCLRKGLLLRFQSNNAATSDGSAQKLGNYVRRNSELIATKVWSQIGRKWNAMFETWKPCSDQRWQDKLFWAIFLFEHSSTVLLTNHPYIYLEDLS